MILQQLLTFLLLFVKNETKLCRKGAELIKMELWCSFFPPPLPVVCLYAPQSMQQFVQQQNFPTDSSRQLLLLLAKLIRLANNQAERFRQTFVQRVIGGSCNSENNNNNNNDTMNMHSKWITKRNCNIINAIFSCICAHWDSALGVCVI